MPRAVGGHLLAASGAANRRSPGALVRRRRWVRVLRTDDANADAVPPLRRGAAAPPRRPEAEDDALTDEAWADRRRKLREVLEPDHLDLPAQASATAFAGVVSALERVVAGGDRAAAEVLAAACAAVEAIAALAGAEADDVLPLAVWAVLQAEVPILGSRLRLGERALEPGSEAAAHALDVLESAAVVLNRLGPADCQGLGERWPGGLL